jgi:hypothetical protein
MEEQYYRGSKYSCALKWLNIDRAKSNSADCVLISSCDPERADKFSEKND